jgi:hypothetical protein
VKSHDTTRKDSQTTQGSATSYRGNNEIETDATTDLFQLFARAHTGLTIRFLHNHIVAETYTHWYKLLLTQLRTTGVRKLGTSTCRRRPWRERPISRASSVAAGAVGAAAAGAALALAVVLRDLLNLEVAAWKGNRSYLG